ncbi:MAG: DUF362 domain-containing protein, partial [candidate division NC10 bacterium]|nr:DUF362 domain-containing protein [candidate division NC10 bacterium]
MHRLTRRELLKAGVATAVLARSARAAVSPVYLVRTTDRAEGIRRGLAALGFPPARGKRVAIKPNFNSADEFPASTHLDTIGALVRQFQAAGAGQITVADRSGMGNTRRVMQQKGVFAQARRMGFQAVVLDETPMNGWIEERLPGGHWSRGVLFPRLLQEADLLVQTCCLKTHRYGGHFTLSLKNSVGMVAKDSPRDHYNYMSELHGSAYQRQMIAEINQLYRPAMVVMDGLEGFTDGGPESGTLVTPQVMVLGSDRVALDAVGVAILRMHGGNATISRGRIFDQEQIARAVQLGLGARGPEQIDLVTDDPESKQLAERVRQILT